MAISRFSEASPVGFGNEPSFDRFPQNSTRDQRLSLCTGASVKSHRHKPHTATSRVPGVASGSTMSFTNTDPMSSAWDGSSGGSRLLRCNRSRAGRPTP